jgi:hypothetical protein
VIQLRPQKVIGLGGTCSSYFRIMNCVLNGLIDPLRLFHFSLFFSFSIFLHLFFSFSFFFHNTVSNTLISLFFSFSLNLSFSYSIISLLISSSCLPRSAFFFPFLISFFSLFLLYLFIYLFIPWHVSFIPVVSLESVF